MCSSSGDPEGIGDPVEAPERARRLSGPVEFGALFRSFSTPPSRGRLRGYFPLVESIILWHL
jgi:hypothetical protein